MGGIAGWYRRSGQPVSPEIITAQCDTMLRRGPDGSGIFTDGDFGFGMRRLAILDLPCGHQPMTTPDGRFAILCDGEIYNHSELRPELRASGYVFRTGSDTETVLAAFTLWGNDAWARLEGMFAVAIWDNATRELTLARDPLGIKPLYLSRQRGEIAFASELKALRPVPGHLFDIEERAVDDFFRFGHVQSPRSIYRRVSQIEPGHFLTVTARSRGHSQAYWRPRFRPAAHRAAADWIEDMRAMLLGSVERHMQSDVPVGALLSGGVASSAVLTAMTRVSAAPIKAFTLGYPGATADETAAVRDIATSLGCEHMVLPFDVIDAMATLVEVQRCHDEPFADMGAMPLWHLSGLASQHVKVVLSGDGGDALFAGAGHHRTAARIARHRPLIDAIGPLDTIVDRIPLTSSRRFNILRQRAQRLAELLPLTDGYQHHFAATEISGRRERERIYAPDFWAAHERLERDDVAAAEMRDASMLEQFLFADLTLGLPSATLPRLDRASMAHSLEARVPLLSHRMVDWALTMPPELKLHGATGQYALRQAIAPWLPPRAANRPKRRLQMPLAEWFRTDLGSFAWEVWSASGAASSGYLAPKAIEALFDEHKRGRADHSRLLYAILVFGLWWKEQHLDAAVPASRLFSIPARSL